MALHQKDIKGWDIIFNEKNDRRRSRSGKSAGIALHRTSDDLTIVEGDCISFSLQHSTGYKVTGLGLVKDIALAVDKFLDVKIMWFVKYNESLDPVLPPLASNGKYTLNDLFLTPLMDSILLDQIVSKHAVVGMDQLATMLADPTVQEKKDLENTFVCRRLADDTTSYFTDIIDWSMMMDLFRENKNEFFDSVKMLTLKPTSKSHKSPTKKPYVANRANRADPGNHSVEEKMRRNKDVLVISDSNSDLENSSSHSKGANFKEDESDEYGDNDNSEDSSNATDIKNDLDGFIVGDDDEEEDDDDNYSYSLSKKQKKKTPSPTKRKYTSRTSSPRKRTKLSLGPELPCVDNPSEILADEELSTAKMLIKAKKILGTGAKLKSLPCREQEFYQIYHALESAVKSQKGCCVYVSGTPGVGKTATIREVIKQLSAQLTLEADGEKVFNYLEINGLKLIKPQQAYEILWKKISSTSASASNSLNFLQQHFEKEDRYESDRKKIIGKEDSSASSPNNLPLVVLLDELDQIVTKNQAVMYNFFNWPTYANSKLIVIAVANTMDLPERLLTNKISSRLGLSRIQFTSYSYNQLSEIIKHRLEQLSKHDENLLIAKDAIEFASRKVASVSGDARRSLMICIRAVEIAQTEFLNKTEPERKELDGKYTVTIMHIMKAVNEASSSPVGGYLNSLSFLSKMVLVSIMLRKKRLGIAEIQVGEVYDELSNQIQVLLFGDLKSKLKEEELDLLDIVFGSGSNKISGSVINASSFILKDLEENGILIIQPLKMERHRLLRLNISDDEILNALKKDPFMKEIITFI